MGYYDYPSPSGSRRRPNGRRRDDFDEYGVSLSPPPPPPGARVSQAEERSRQETDAFFSRATGAPPEPPQPRGLLGLPPTPEEPRSAPIAPGTASRPARAEA